MCLRSHAVCPRVSNPTLGVCPCVSDHTVCVHVSPTTYYVSVSVRSPCCVSTRLPVSTFKPGERSLQNLVETETGGWGNL
jgi:hypothetical protein